MFKAYRVYHWGEENNPRDIVLPISECPYCYAGKQFVRFMEDGETTVIGIRESATDEMHWHEVTFYRRGPTTGGLRCACVSADAVRARIEEQNLEMN